MDTRGATVEAVEIESFGKLSHTETHTIRSSSDSNAPSPHSLLQPTTKAPETFQRRFFEGMCYTCIVNGLTLPARPNFQGRKSLLGGQGVQASAGKRASRETTRRKNELARFPPFLILIPHGEVLHRTGT